MLASFFFFFKTGTFKFRMRSFSGEMQNIYCSPACLELDYKSVLLAICRSLQKDHSLQPANNPSITPQPINHVTWNQGCPSPSRPFWLEPEPFFGPGPAPIPTPTLTLQYCKILFLRDPRYDFKYNYKHSWTQLLLICYPLFLTD